MIYRGEIKNLNVGSINDDIFNKSSRFIIGGKKAIQSYFSMRKILESNDLAMKMDFVRQYCKLETTCENADTIEISKFYLNKYDNEGGLSSGDEQEFQAKIQRISIEAKKRRIK